MSWVVRKVGVTGAQLADLLLSSPQIIIPAAEDSIAVMPYMMMPGDDKIVAPRVFELLTNPPRRQKPAVTGSTAQVDGQWDVEISYTRDHAVHTLFLEQKGERLMGSPHGDFLAADLSGGVQGSNVRCHSNHCYEGTGIGYTFEGVADGDSIRGAVHVGEYGKAPFTARRHFHA